MHRWGDGFPYFAEVGQAAYEIGEFLRKWGRVSVRDTKEKYGTVRVYLSLGWYQLHSFTHPGYCYSQYPGWLWKLDVFYFSKIFSKLNYIVVPFHVWLYKLAYKRALKKYPFIREEILCCADYPKLLKGLNEHPAS